MRFLIALVALPLALAAPVANTGDGNAGTDKYIVVMKSSSGASAEHVLQPNGILQSVRPTHHYNAGSFRGFAASLSADQVAALTSHADVSNNTCFSLLLNLL
jgi:hypothetical protein